MGSDPTTSQIVSGDGTPYQMHTDKSIWAYNGQPLNSDWTQIDNNPNSDLIVAFSFDIYQMYKDGSIWQYDGFGWSELDNNTLTISIAPPKSFL